MPTAGEDIAESVRAYLFTNGLKKAYLSADEPSKLLAEIANRVLANRAKQAAMKKRLATEEEWIAELEQEPHLAGVNVRKELAAAQFWCKNNGRQCTRKFFVNWLNNAERSAVISPGGAKPTAEKLNGHGPAGWLSKLNELFPGSTKAKGGVFEVKVESDYEWSQLDKETKKRLAEAM